MHHRVDECHCYKSEFQIKLETWNLKLESEVILYLKIEKYGQKRLNKVSLLQILDSTQNNYLNQAENCEIIFLCRRDCLVLGQPRS